MRKSEGLILAIILGLFLLFAGCATKKLESRLDPLSDEFFDKVRYIITRAESKIFLELPPSARADFIEEFWQRRDPTPGTEMNEYKEAYFERIEEANRLFKGGGRPGWLQDRGRIYILFGPPNERETNPMGGRVVDPYVDPQSMVGGQRYATGEKPTEIWVYYNLFSSMQRPHAIRLIFVDSYSTGDYRLATNLDEVIPGTMGAETLFSPNLVLTHELYKEESERARLYLQRALFDFSWEFLKKKNRELGSNLSLNIALPYNRIIFTKEGERVKAKLEMEIQIKSASDEVVWEFREEYKLNLNSKFLKENKGEVWSAEVPVTKWLDKGEYSVYIHLKNLSGDQKIEKLLPLKM